MNIGMLWFDNQPDKDFETKVLEAIGHYRSKYGIEANQVIVHPTMVAKAGQRIAEAIILTNRTVLPNHFWVGRKKDSNGK